MTHLQSVLAEQFGFSNFREGQEQVISSLLSGQSTLAVFPTGSGKSLCYQFTALQLPHLTLVVSPLLALMQDQLSFLADKGIAAASIDSTLSYQALQATMADVKSGKTRILMVSVERFKNERFRQFINTIDISLLVIDEAHCISEWGHNFRPDYLKLPQYKQSLNIPTVLLLTATATAKVKRDMASKFGIDNNNIVQTGFYRSNLTLNVLSVDENQKNQKLVDVIKPFTGDGIVYVTLQHTAEQVALFLQQQGINAQAYHAGLSSDLRQKLQSEFMNGGIQVIVATIAFGMGIDKSNIRFVIHYDLPKSIENYSQEIGRAGRDGELSHCITLANLDGLNTVENFVYGDTPEQQAISEVLRDISTNSVNGQWEMQVMALASACNIRQLPLKTLLVQLELLGVLVGKFTYFADFKFKFIETEQNILNRFSGERVEFLKQIFNSAMKKRVWAEPDFQALHSKFQAPRARVIAALEYLNEQHLIALETKKMTEVYEVNLERLNSPSLVTELTNYFHQKETSEIARIATLVRFFQLTDCLNNNLARYFDDKLAPQRCGHCSSCHNQAVVLTRSNVVVWPSDDEITTYIEQLKQQLGGAKTSLALAVRFLLGLSTPLFTRMKVRKLQGFGRCESIRYEEMAIKLQQLQVIEPESSS